MTVEEPPDRTNAGLLLSLRAQTHSDFLERQVRFRGDQLEQPLLVLLQRRAAVPRAGLGLDVSGLSPPIHPSDRRRSAKVENACASRALSPDSTSSTTRTLRSLEYPFAMACSRLLLRETLNLICETKGIPHDRSDSHQLETGLAPSSVLRASDS